MTTFVSRNDFYYVFDMVTIRAYLRAITVSRWETARDFGKRSGLGYHPAIVMALFQELADSGVILQAKRQGIFEGQQHLRQLTDLGMAILSATAQKRQPKTKAQKVIAEVISNIEAANLDDKLPFYVSQVWLFGSMVRPEATDVGDIDIVFDMKFRDVAKTAFFRQPWDYVKEHYPGLMPASFGGHPFEYLRRVKIFSPKRNPLLAPNELSNLIDMHVPCQLIFDKERGGIVSDPVLPHHPLSKERSDRFDEKLHIPDADDLTTEFKPLSTDSENILLWQNWLAFNGSGIEIVDPATTVGKKGLDLPQDVLEGLDGRHKTLLICQYGKEVGYVLLEKSLCISDDGNQHNYELKANFVSGKQPKSKFSKTRMCSAHIKPLAQIAVTELARLHLRREHEASDYDIAIKISGDVISDPEHVVGLELELARACFGHFKNHSEGLARRDSYWICPNSGLTAISINGRSVIEYESVNGLDMSATLTGNVLRNFWKDRLIGGVTHHMYYS
ncbi:hypothetical protein [Mesorhizobium sp. SP-1A]|uniref:hypothetical protein n=1 Tax=Mesorhizobium sp. SP-1A TaxID=3077840 RepID=UPI0028F70656|nr:hypothetical protein [Mesorhizobium sp. SP-1A]